MTALEKNHVSAFRRKIWRFYSRYGRRLPFRETTDPYKITVAEFMLQQTQVARVVPKYNTWIRIWPAWTDLATANNRELLRAWSGLGYNRRALYLGQSARIVMRKFSGRLPDDPDILRSLPGVGSYTARAILIFAFNRPLVTIDTNILRVLIREFDLPPHISTIDLEKLAERLLPTGRSRDWHNALMDYSQLTLPAHLPDVPTRIRQAPFRGSRRQLRGEIIRRLTVSPRVSIDRIARETERRVDDVAEAARSLDKDGMVRAGRCFVSLR